MVECELPKLEVAGSKPVARSMPLGPTAGFAKQEVDLALFGKPRPPQEEHKNDTAGQRAPESHVAPPVSTRIEPKPANPPEARRDAVAQSKAPEPARVETQRKGVNAIIGSSIVIKGELLGEEELVIEGRVEGKIHIKNNLIVGQKGSVEADIQAQSVVINGRVHGNIVADRVEIVASGSLEGNIKAPKISIADGAHFKGSVDMGHVPEKEAPPKPVMPQRPVVSVAPPPVSNKPDLNLKL